MASVNQLRKQLCEQHSRISSECDKIENYLRQTFETVRFRLKIIFKR